MIKVGILGTGFGAHHAELYKKIEGYELVSVFGRNEDKLKEINEKINVGTTTDINDIIKNPHIDLVDICLPTEFHSEWAIEGLKNGKHIFCETPAVYKIEEAENIKQAAAEYGRNVYVNLFIKFSTPHEYAASLIKKAELGQLLSIRSYNKTAARWGDLGFQKNIENFHNHNMDFILEIAGMPKSATASGIDYGNKSVITSALNYDNLYAVMESSSALPDCCPFEIGFELIFTDGIVRYDGIYGDYTKEEFSIMSNGKPREVISLEQKDETKEVIRHILYCLNNNIKSELIDIESAVNMVKLKNMIIESIRDTGGRKNV